MIHSLFPTPIGRYELGREYSGKEKKLIDSLERSGNQGNEISINKGVLELKEFSAIRKFLESSVNAFFSEVYQPTRDVELMITQSWINYTTKGKYHHIHTHQNSFLSGVLYIQAIREVDKIHFYNEGYNMIHFYPKEFNVWNSKSWWMDTGVGDLLLFPSGLSHGVEPVETDSRISLSFNTFPVGLFGGHLTSNSLEVLKVGPGNRD